MVSAKPFDTMYNFQKIYSSKFNNVYFEAKYSLLKMVALPETTLMEDAVYKKELTRIIEIVEAYTPTYWLFNNAQNKLRISLELQNWQHEQMLSFFKKTSISKSATVIGTEFILQSIRQHPQTHPRTALVPSQYFTNEEDALLWLVGSIKTSLPKKVVSK